VVDLRRSATTVGTYAVIDASVAAGRTVEPSC
jgi:hypothetical protein